MNNRSLTIVAAVAFVACSSSGPQSEPVGRSMVSAITTGDVIGRAEQWVSAQVPYCQAANHEPDGDPSCASVCTRPDNPDWDPYRSDCSGFVSWSWGLPAPGRTTSELAPADTGVSSVIDGASLMPGDALNIPGDHVLLFKNWITPGQRATFLEEPGCSASTPYAHEFDSNVTVSGSDVSVDYEGKTFTAIRYDSIAAGGGGGGGGGGQPPSGNPVSAGRVCPTGSETITGIDVSKYDGTIDWVTASGTIQFAFARISDGTANPDATFADNWAGMQSAGIVRGAYQFFRASVDPIAQANLVVSSLQSAGGLADGDLPVVMDIETSDGQSADTVQANMQAWLDQVAAATGKLPIIYTNNATSQDIGTGFSSYPLWVANYTNACPLLPDGWSGWQFWQSTDSGSVSGVSSAVDLDTFNGSLSDLRALAGAGGQPGPPPPPSPDPGGDAGPPPPPPPPPPGSGGDAGIPQAGQGGDGDPCQTDLDCSGILLCAAGTCTAGAQGDSCGSDGDCQYGLACLAGVCSPDNSSGIGCSCDGDCNPGADGSGQICASGTCVDGCNATWECPGVTSCVGGQCQ